MQTDTGLDLIDQDIVRQPSLLRAVLPDLRSAAQDVVAQIGTEHARVYLVGCGDSLDAGIAARYVWEPMLSIPVEAMPAMTFSSRAVDAAPPGSLVVSLSQSGRVSRVIEGVRAARARGLTTVAITASSTSPLAHEPADATWVMPFTKLGAIPGTTSYLQGSLAFYELGIALAGARSDALRAEVEMLPGLCEEVIRMARPVAKAHADAIERPDPILALGYGPTFASTRFTIRKILETSQLVAWCQETEEYAHDEYSLVDSRFRMLQFAPPDRGRHRSLEVASYLRRLGSHIAVVTDEEGSHEFRAAADLVYALPSAPASITPLLYAIPGQLLSLSLARRLGGSLYGMAERVHAEDGDPQIYESELVVP